MANLNHIDISKKILSLYKGKKGLNKYQIKISLEREGLAISRDTITRILDFLITNGFISKSEKQDTKKREYYQYFKVYDKPFIFHDYIDVKEFSKQTFYCQATIRNKRFSASFNDCIKIGSKFYINKNQIELQRSL